MGHVAETLERAEHTAHAGHHGQHDGDRLPTKIGVTMAILGVVLAFVAARVGYERAELVQYLVDQQHAHSKYQAQDIKHRAAVLSLRVLHATADGAKANANDLVMLARSADRYLAESRAASRWVETYDPIILAHSKAQEEYEHAQVAVELGVVIASIALLLRRRSAWILSMLLGAGAMALLAVTYFHTAHQLHGTEAKVEEAEKAYRSLRESGKTTDVDQQLVDEVLKTYGGGDLTR